MPSQTTPSKALTSDITTARRPWRCIASFNFREERKAEKSLRSSAKLFRSFGSKSKTRSIKLFKTSSEAAFAISSTSSRVIVILAICATALFAAVVAILSSVDISVNTCDWACCSALMIGFSIGPSCPVTGDGFSRASEPCPPAQGRRRGRRARIRRWSASHPPPALLPCDHGRHVERLMRDARRVKPGEVMGCCLHRSGERRC